MKKKIILIISIVLLIILNAKYKFINLSVDKEYIYSLEQIRFEKGIYEETFKTKNDYYFSVHGNDNLYYIYDSNIKLISDDGYNSIEDYFNVDNETYFIVSINDKYGIINSKGNTIVELKYDYIYNKDDIKNTNYLILYNKKDYTLAYIKNKKVIYGKTHKLYKYSDEETEIIKDCKVGYCPIIEDNKLQYIDYKGNIIKVSEKYNKVNISNNIVEGTKIVVDNLIFDIKNNLYFTIIENDKIGLINNQGKILIEPNYYEIRYIYSFKVFIAIGKENTVIMDPNGKKIADLTKFLDYDEDYNYQKEYSDSGDFIDDEYFQIKDNKTDKKYIFNKKYRLMNQKNNVEYYFKNNYITTNRKDNKVVSYNIYDYNDKLLFKNIAAVAFKNDKDKSYMSVCKKYHECELYNSKGKKIFNKKYKSIEKIYNNLVYVIDNNEFLILDLNENLVKKVASYDKDDKIIFYFDETLNKKQFKLEIYFSDDPKTIYEENTDREIFIDKNGKIKKDTITNKTEIFYTDKDIKFTSMGIYDDNWKFKELQVKGNQESFEWANLIKTNDSMYYILYRFKDKETITNSMYKIIKTEK